MKYMGNYSYPDNYTEEDAINILSNDLTNHEYTNQTHIQWLKDQLESVGIEWENE